MKIRKMTVRKSAILSAPDGEEVCDLPRPLRRRHQLLRLLRQLRLITFPKH